MSSALVNSAWFFIVVVALDSKSMECFYLIYDIWETFTRLRRVAFLQCSLLAFHSFDSNFTTAFELLLTFHFCLLVLAYDLCIATSWRQLFYVQVLAQEFVIIC